MKNPETITKYTVYAINPLGEKEVVRITFDGNEADDILAQIDGAWGWDWDYGVDEEPVVAHHVTMSPVEIVYAYEFKNSWGEINADWGTRADALKAKKEGLAYQIETVHWGQPAWSRFTHDGYYVDFEGVHIVDSGNDPDDLPF